MAKSNTKFEGIISAIVTPFCADNKTVNVEMAKKVIDTQLADGAKGFYVLGGTGEGYVMGREEREIMCVETVKHIAGRVPVINHVASANLNEAIELAKHAEKCGVDAIAAIPPLLYGYSDDEVYNYYKKLAASVHIPVIIYFFPTLKMSAELIARTFEIDNVTGVKWSSDNLYEMMRLIDMTKGEMNIISGGDEFLLPAFAAGADAGIGSAFNLMLKDFVSLYDDFKSRNLERAFQTQLKINRVIDLMYKYGILPSVKQGMKLMGLDVGNATFPFKEFSEEEAIAFEKDMRATGWPFN